METKRALLTFTYSVPEKFKGVNLPNYPVQIIPYSRTRINEREIICYPKLEKNIGGVVHVAYLCHPFGKKFEQFENINMLRTYRQLCERISYNFLCHGPSNMFEMDNLARGMSVIRDVFKGFSQKVIIEVPAFNSGMRMDIDEYIQKIVDEFPEDGFEICIDTAHLHANGCDSTKIIETCKKFSKYISTIHLNGNANEQFKTDLHTEIFNEKSKLKNIKEMMTFFKESGYLMIAEVRRAEFGYNDWKTFADSYGIEIVEFSEKLILKHEKVL